MDERVYSTHPGIFMKKEAPPPNSGNPLPPLGQEVRLRREKSGRAGKTVTAVFGFQTSEAQREALGKRLQKALGTGGTVKDGRIEVQGDQLAKAVRLLEDWGYKPRQAGG